MKKRKCIFTLLFALGTFVLLLAGCENKNSRAWIENKISAVERVYPTENLYDLFEEFPDGFTVKVSERYSKEGARYNRKVILIGNPESKTIKGTASITLLELKPEYKETLMDSSDLEYTRSGEFVLANTGASAELFPYKEKGFLFQKLTLNKKVLSTLELEDASYNWQSKRAYISYKVRSAVINDYFSIKKEDVVAMIFYPNPDESDIIPSVNYKTSEINYWETIDSGMEDE